MHKQFKSVIAKLGNMKRPQEFTVCPRPTNLDTDDVTIQSDKRIARFNPTTLQGVVSNGKGGHPGFLALSPMFNPIPITVTREFADECLANLPKKGDVLFGGILTIG